MTSPVRWRWASWALLALSLFVVAWGAFVRVAGAGDACAGGWPLCRGQAIPIGLEPAAWLAWSHRASSALLVMACLVFSVVAWRGGRFARGWAIAALVALLAESLLGAGVALGWGDAGGQLAMTVAHVAGTFVFLAAITGLVWATSMRDGAPMRGNGHVATLVGFALAGVLAMACVGSAAALGGDGLVTLGGDELLARWRLASPLLTVSIGVLVAVCAAILAQRKASEATARLAMLTQGLAATHLGLGLVAALMPGQGWTHLVGFVTTQALWVVMVALGLAAASASSQEQAEKPARTPAALRELPGLYVAVTKPRVISLLLFTTLTSALVAAGGWPGGWLMLALALGGYGMAGAANAINMVIDRDIDARMARTAKRPTVDGRLSGPHALTFAVLMAASSFALLAGVTNVLAATLSLTGLAFYVVVYTLLLKRRTWHNIVLGGAAGAFPPLVGYAAVAGELSPLAWTLFAIVFFWTPVHFWALALTIRDEYAGVGVPMLPVVRGERATVVQIVAYGVLTVALSLAPLFQRQANQLYLVLAVLLNVALVASVARLVRVPDRPHALALFKTSMVYLALLFLGVAIDRSLL